MRLRAICKSKIHHAVVTEANVDYVGSIAIDGELLARADILPGEKVALWNVNSGARVETYAIPAPAGGGDVVVNGGAARHFQPGDRVIVVAFLLTDERIEPRMFAVDEHNRFASWLSRSSAPDGFAEELVRAAEEV